MEKKKMISPNGIKFNMCCASCLYNTIEMLSPRGNLRVWCSKKNIAIQNQGNLCNYYVMAKFFQERGYKPMKD